MSFSTGAGGKKGGDNTGYPLLPGGRRSNRAPAKTTRTPYEVSDDEDVEEEDDSISKPLGSSAPKTPSAKPSAGQGALTGDLGPPRQYQRYANVLTGRNLLWILGELRRNPFTGVWEENASPIKGVDYAKFVGAPEKSNPQSGWRKKARAETPREELTDTVAQQVYQQTFPLPQDEDNYNRLHPPDPTMPPTGSAPAETLQAIKMAIREHQGRQSREAASNTSSTHPRRASTTVVPGRMANPGPVPAYDYIDVNGILYARIPPANTNAPEFRVFPGYPGSYVLSGRASSNLSGVVADPYDYMYFNGILYARIPPTADNAVPSFDLDPGTPGVYVLSNQGGVPDTGALEATQAGFGQFAGA